MSRRRYHYEQIALVSGAIVPEKHYAIWCSSDGVALVFDYLHGQWLEFTNHVATDCVQAGGYPLPRDSGRHGAG